MRLSDDGGDGIFNTLRRSIRGIYAEGLATFATHPPLRHAPRRRLNQRLEELRDRAYL